MYPFLLDYMDPVMAIHSQTILCYIWHLVQFLLESQHQKLYLRLLLINISVFVQLW